MAKIVKKAAAQKSAKSTTVAPVSIPAKLADDISHFLVQAALHKTGHRTKTETGPDVITNPVLKAGYNFAEFELRSSILEYIAKRSRRPENDAASAVDEYMEYLYVPIGPNEMVRVSDVVGQAIQIVSDLRNAPRNRK